MIKYIRKLILIFVLIFCGYFFTNQVKASQLYSPTILEVGSGKYGNGISQPYIKGLTSAGSDILVYINDEYVGQAIIGSTGTETDSFYYSHPKSLSAGIFKIKIVSQDRESLSISEFTEAQFQTPGLPAPIVIFPNEDSVIGKTKPNITGLSVSGSFVRIYIDGVYNGKTEILNNNSGTADFVYKPFLNLGVGEHEVWAIAEDALGRKSSVSSVIKFNIETPMPAPTLVQVLNNKIKYNQPIVTGLSKNDSVVNIFVDHELVETIEVDNDKSGTANFAQITKFLSRGSHLVYATAVDKRGKESKWSNIIYFNVRQPIIADSAYVDLDEDEMEDELTNEDNVDIISNEDDVFDDKAGGNELVDNEIIIDDSNKIADDSSDVQDQDNVLNQKVDENEKATTTIDINKIIDNVDKQSKIDDNSSGIIDEDKNQNKLKLNTIVFILFLLSVIAWIIWVNRELIRESQNKEE